MKKINLLSDHLINQIAAGEVVERPASVVKELLENSVDAGATKIVLEIEKGGIDLIKIIDNGSGMSKEDALMCLERHATSKINSLEDLHNVLTMGFRGEALASIASVARLNLRTRSAGEESGTEILTEGGTVLKVSPIGCPEGTEIEMQNLFFNTPARLKFLKSEQTEYQNIVDCLLNAAMVFEKIAFKLINNGKVVFDLPASEDETVRMRGVLGKGIVDDLIPIFYGGVNLKMTGYIGKPSLSRANKNMQYFFVNNRPINSYVLAYAVKQAYHSLLAKERYPVFVVKFEMEPSMVDVNCHPRKTEVKFTDEREVYRVLAAACAKSLQENILTPKMNGGFVAFEKNSAEVRTAVAEKENSSNYYQEKRSAGLAQLSFEGLQSGVRTVVQVGAEEAVQNNAEVKDTEIVWPSDSTSFQQVRTEKKLEVEKDSYPLLALGQLNNSFILCQRGDDLIIVDQHAAHERIRYNKLMAEGENDEKVIQPLLVAVNLELSQQDIAVLNNNKDALEAAGIGIEHFGGNTFSVTEVPAFLAKANIEKVLLGLLDDFRSSEVIRSGHKGDFYARKEKILTYLACRSAVKFGDPLSREEMVALIKQLEEEVVGKATCPHGRPTMIIMEANELWSRFGRKYTGFFEEEKFRDVNC